MSKPASDWKELSALAGGRHLQVERVRLTGTDIAIEGNFALPPLAQLSMDDQIFVAAFVKSHGSIKEMERLFGVSYPTIKNRLNRIGEAIGSELGVETDPAPSRSEILERLERGELSPQQAAKELKR